MKLTLTFHAKITFTTEDGREYDVLMFPESSIAIPRGTVGISIRSFGKSTTPETNTNLR